MDNIYDTTVDGGSVHEERSDGADSPDREPKYENSGEATEQLYSEVQVHAYAGVERSSPDYMDTRDGNRQSSSSSSSSDDEEVKEEEEVKAEVEPEPVVEVQVEEVNGEAHGGSRRSSASSASSASPGDPCDDPPRIQEEDNTEDGMLMAYTRRDTETKPEESVDYSLMTLENVNLDESSAAPADPSQPDISLFVKVRNTCRSAENHAGFAGVEPGPASVTVPDKAAALLLFFHFY